MANFTHLNKLNASGNIVDFPMSELGTEAVLQLISATEGNPGYMNGLLKLSGNTKGARRRKSTSIDAEEVSKHRKYDKEIYPGTVIVGWSGVLDSKKKAVAFSVEEVKELLAQLPDYLFDDIRDFANNPENFIMVIDSEEKGKN